jgi:hypothetical protein
MKNYSPLIAGSFAALTVLVASPPQASANFKRLHSSSCMEDSLQPQALFQDQFLLNVSANLFDVFFCAMPEDTAIRKDRVIRLNLFGVDESTTNPIFARACVGFSGGFGQACDATVTNGDPTATGTFTLAIPHTTWNTSHRLDFAFVQVAVPPIGTSFSGISGLFIADING